MAVINDSERPSHAGGASDYITHERAMESVLRLIAGAFGREDNRPRFSIPCRSDDDDRVVVAYINQQRAIHLGGASNAEVEAAARAIAARKTGIKDWTGRQLPYNLVCQCVDDARAALEAAAAVRDAAIIADGVRECTENKTTKS